MILERELQYYQLMRDEWLRHYEGKYALIRGNELVGTFTTIEEAYEEGVKRFGTDPFLIKRISKDEPLEQIPAFFLGLSNARLF